MNIEAEKILYSKLAMRCRRARQMGNKRLANKLRTRCAKMRVKWARNA